MEITDEEIRGDALAPPRRRLRELMEKLDAMAPRRFIWLALGVFVLISLSVYWPQVPGATHSVVGCPCGDVMQEVWFLKWTPWAILHGHNPMFTNWMDYPTGANLATNTVMPGLAVLAAPVTWLLGPVSSYNLLMWASFPVSALACFYVVRRLSGSNVGAFLAGAIYGFSPYMLAQGYGHLFLIFVPLPPLIFYALFRICVTQGGSARRWGLILGALIIAEFFVSQEVAADVLIVGFFALVILVLAQRHDLDATRWRYVGRAALYAAGVVIVVLAYPVYFQIFGPQAIHGATHGTTHSPLKLDVLGTLVPDRLQWLHPSFLTRLGNQFMGSDLAENGSYLGAPLVVALGIIVWTLRRQRWVLYVALVLFVTEVLSMGRWLMVANHTIHVPLPWAALAKLPLLQADLPNRFSLFASFWVALLVALGVARWTAWAREQSDGEGRDRRRGVHVALSALTLASVAVYVPQLRIPTSPLPSVPAFFTSSDVLQIPEGSVVLPFPLTASPYAASMYWQILSDFRWKMIGGEAIIPTPRGHVTGQPAATRPVAVTQFIAHYSGANTRLPTFNQALVVRMREFLFLNRVGTVVLDPSTANADKVRALFEAAMGPPLNEGGVSVWFHAQALARQVASARG
ncbi:MAG: hypothetical protein PXZ08_10115 [Actinomycetota bacterium]|nr:hypothetical protein [Actinomycetota bacterium]